MAESSYQVLVSFANTKARPFVGWFNGDMVEQAIAAAISAARECGCKLNVRKVEILAVRRQRGEM